MCQCTDFLGALCSFYVKQLYEAFALDTRAIEGQEFHASPSKQKQIILNIILHFGLVLGLVPAPQYYFVAMTTTKASQFIFMAAFQNKQTDEMMENTK